MVSLTERASTATWWSTLEICSRYGAQMIVSIVLARLLTPSDFGLIAMLLVFTSIGALLVDSGFGTALIQRRNVTVDDETTVFIFALVSGLAVGGIIWLSAPAIASFYRQPELVALTHLVVLVIPLGALTAVPDALLTRRLNFASRAHAELIASSVSGALAIALAWLGYGVWSMAWQVVATMTLRALLLWYFARWTPRGKFTKQAFSRLFGFGGFMLLARLLDVAFVRMQSLLLGRYFDASTLGFYTLAQNAQQAPASFIGAILDRVGLPVFSEIADQPDKLRNALRLTLRTSFFLFLPGMAALALLAKPLIILVYGAQWQTAAPILTLLALSAALWPLHVLNLAVLTASGRSDLLFHQEVAKKLISISLIVVASPAGPVPVAGAVLVSSAFGAFINTWQTRRMLGYGLLAQLFDQRLTISLCLASAAAGWIVLHYAPPGLTSMIPAILVAGLIYVGGAFTFGSTALSELLKMTRMLMSKKNHR
ncbi:lipopolysaccharide biosynthesis protein [Oleiagrimonas soli]|uniref:O-antigen/teichoic acid export membrane protein n=1 Tax=Oleiagrimonas soli TaxID=1543381 RepID=A0A099CTX7_9GAMM|nr:lipopolysaccharide biosynthesis protein [Oleiagrimonas soli]KGI77249.1 hypothetical protein LF63_0111695 [Oleiagrimonas soli]MBB6185562.1 O-antigen/teichoic acid export membrane protein [Oleiagrimonas soli]